MTDLRVVTTEGTGKILEEAAVQSLGRQSLATLTRLGIRTGEGGCSGWRSPGQRTAAAP